MPKPLKIGFTFDRRSDYTGQGVTTEDCAQFDADDTIEAIATAITNAGHQVDPVGNLQAVVGRLAQDPLPDWDLVFNYSEGTNVGCPSMREAKLAALLESYGYELIFADSAGMVKGHDKVATKMVLDYHGIPTAPWVFIPPLAKTSLDTPDLTPAQTAIRSAKNFNRVQLGAFPLFAKPSAEACSVGNAKIVSADELEGKIAQLRGRFPTQEIIVEQFLSGREITVAIVGTGEDSRVLGAAEFVFAYQEENWLSYSLKFGDRTWKCVYHSGTSSVDPVIRRCYEVALRAWRATGCRDLGRVDIRADENNQEAYVLEVEPLAALRPGWSILPLIAEQEDISYSELIRMAIESARKRLNDTSLGRK